MQFRVFVLTITLALAPATAIHAHHAFAAEFDVKKPLNLRGKVTKMEWINPHAWIHIDVTAENGKTESWMVECGAPNGLLRRGFSKASLPAGTEILVTGWRAKDDSNRMNGSDVTLPDGKKLFLGSSNSDAPGAASK
jgi:hypothetical protein